METPSSTRRVTRSQTAALQSSASKLGDGDRRSRSRNHRADRHALFDITNDSPIAGVALGATESKTPALLVRKMVPIVGPGDTPCSGENLLRCQVKSLLQRVEEESEIPKVENQHLYLQKHCLDGKDLASPAGLLAPTPENTPEIFVSVPLDSKPASTFQLPDALGDLNVDTAKTTESPVTRTLTFDSPEKAEGDTVVPIPSSSVLIYREKLEDDEDDCSDWSVHVHVSSPPPQKAGEEDADFEEEEEEAELDEDNNEIDDDLCEELCREMSKVSVGESGCLPTFEGTHTRFIYNSDDEIEEEEVVVMKRSSSPNALHLKGLPTPKGKHVRFPEDDME